MTIEEKDLLLRDLCARVPYHPKGRVVNNQTGAMCEEWLTCATFQMFVNVTNNCRLYLRPMSSMTNEEMDKYHQLYNEQYKYNVPYFTFCGKVADYLDSIHIDHRTIRDEGGKEKTMIELGLALEAPEGMYETKGTGI